MRSQCAQNMLKLSVADRTRHHRMDMERRLPKRRVLREEHLRVWSSGCEIAAKQSPRVLGGWRHRTIP